MELAHLSLSLSVSLSASIDIMQLYKFEVKKRTLELSGGRLVGP